MLGAFDERGGGGGGGENSPLGLKRRISKIKRVIRSSMEIFLEIIKL